MALPTARYLEAATVSIDYEKCKACGLCARICKGAPLHFENSKVRVDQALYFGCIGCGHCAAVCPTGSITVEGKMYLRIRLWTPLPKKSGPGTKNLWL